MNTQHQPILKNTLTEFKPKLRITSMNKPLITDKDIERLLKKAKTLKRLHDKIAYNQPYKFLNDSEACIAAIRMSLNKILEGVENILLAQKKSETKFIPKCREPTAKDLCPITLANITYKSFMAIIRGKKRKSYRNKQSNSGQTICVHYGKQDWGQLISIKIVISSLKKASL